MRLPYLQVTQETWGYAKQFAALAQMDVGAAFMAICDLWQWGLSLGPEDEPPTGICASPRAARLVASAIGWPGDPDELVEVLADLGLIEVLEVGIRVRGMGRYKRTWEKNHRRTLRQTDHATGPQMPATGATGAGYRHPDGTKPATTAPKPAPQTQTQTQIEKATSPRARARDEGEDVIRASLPERLQATWLREKGSPYAWEYTKDDPACLSALAKATGDPDEVNRRWVIALRVTRYPLCGSVADLVKHWNAYATDEPQFKPRPSNGRAGEAEKDWANARYTTTDDGQIDLNGVLK